MDRKPVVAGSFYPNDSQELKEMIISFLENAPVEKDIKNILSVISPHAGYIYSGQVAAYSYNVLSNKEFSTAVIIAPSHHFAGFKFSIGNFDRYITPLGAVKVNKEYSEMLLSNYNFDFIIDAHRYEHSLEVQIPFLQIINPNVDIVPILFGNQTINNAEILSDILKNVFQDKLDEVVFVVSSDLSHYHTSDIALRKDLYLSELLKKRNEKNLWHKYLNKEVEACGIGGILSMLMLSNLLDYNKISILKYMHSGEINNDYSQVVGYLSSVSYK